MDDSIGEPNFNTYDKQDGTSMTAEKRREHTIDERAFRKIPHRNRNYMNSHRRSRGDAVRSL